MSIQFSTRDTIDVHKERILLFGEILLGNPELTVTETFAEDILKSVLDCTNALSVLDGRHFTAVSARVLIGHTYLQSKELGYYDKIQWVNVHVFRGSLDPPKGADKQQQRVPCEPKQAPCRDWCVLFDGKQLTKENFERYLNDIKAVDNSVSIVESSYKENLSYAVVRLPLDANTMTHIKSIKDLGEAILSIESNDSGHVKSL